MFLQEIENAEIIRQNWCRRLIYWMFCKEYRDDLIEPDKLNKFISGIMDPFKDKEQDDLIRMKERERQELRMKQKKIQDKIDAEREAKLKKKQLEKEKWEEEKKLRNIVCWPFCYSIPNEKKMEDHEYNVWKMNRDEAKKEELKKFEEWKKNQTADVLKNMEEGKKKEDRPTSPTPIHNDFKNHTRRNRANTFNSNNRLNKLTEEDEHETRNRSVLSNIEKNLGDLPEKINNAERKMSETKEYKPESPSSSSIERNLGEYTINNKSSTPKSSSSSTSSSVPNDLFWH